MRPRDSSPDGYPKRPGAARPTAPTIPQSYEVGSKNNFDDRLKIATSVYYIKWNNIQQNVYVAGNCGLQFTDNLGTAVAKGFDLQAERTISAAASTFDFSAGYTNARFTKTRSAVSPSSGDAISGNAAINYAPGTSPPWTIALGPQYNFKALRARGLRARSIGSTTSRNPWLAPVQDPNNNAQYNSGFSYTLPATSFTLGARRHEVRRLGHLGVLRQPVEHAHGRQLCAGAGRRLQSCRTRRTPQENDFTFRPRTVRPTSPANPDGRRERVRARRRTRRPQATARADSTPQASLTAALRRFKALLEHGIREW